MTETRATCTGEGRKVKAYTICEAELEVETSAATGHTYSAWEMVKAATMNNEGEEIRHCIHCGETVTKVTQRLDLLEGLFGR